MATKSFKCLKFKQDQATLYLTPMKVEDISEYARIHRFNPDLDWTDPNQGYQRKEEARYRKLKPYMDRNERLLPTSLLLNHRDGVQYNPETSEITLDTANRPYLVDGQHRLRGLQYAIEKARGNAQLQSGIKNFILPVVIISGLDKLDEMKQFKIINDTQKKIRTDLVNSILAQISRTEGEEEMDRDEIERVVCAEVTKIINQETDSPWKHLILMPNEKPITVAEKRENPGLEHVKILKATSFQTSIKPIYKFLRDNEHLDSNNPQAQATQITSIIKNYWQAIKDIARDTEIFQNPGDFVMQKTPGMFSLHMVLKKLLPKMYIARQDWNKDNFKLRIQNCEDLSSESYWDTTGDGAAVFGSMKGFSELADRLWDQISEEE